jgi:hypothetical protein
VEQGTKGLNMVGEVSLTKIAWVLLPALHRGCWGGGWVCLWGISSILDVGQALGPILSSWYISMEFLCESRVFKRPPPACFSRWWPGADSGSTMTVDRTVGLAYWLARPRGTRQGRILGGVENTLD